MQGITQKLTSRLTSPALIAGLFIVCGLIFFGSSASAAATVTKESNALAVVSGPSAANLDPCTANNGFDPDPSSCCITDAQIAANATLCKDYACKDAKHCNLTEKYINPIINKFLAPLAILAVIIGIIWGAIQYITSAGDAQKVAEGRNKIQKALLGLLTFVFLYALLNWLIPGGLL